MEGKMRFQSRWGEVVGVVLDTIGQWIAGYLQKEVPGYEPFTPSDPEHLRGVIQPGDVLLVEGNNRISGIIKYLTQSTWSHAALYVGPVDGASEPDGEPHVLIEANIGEGVTSAPLSKYLSYHTRMCRPVGLSYEDRITVCRYAINRIGFGYDTKNIVDLMRFLIPMPVPQRWRRRLIAFGSGDPTKIICSALIAQAFDAVRYPILPKITQAGSRRARREILHIRDSSLYMPRDFDISPYFEIVKPTIVNGFDYLNLHWADKQKPLEEVAGEFGVFQEEVWSPSIVPEEADETTTVSDTEVTVVEIEETLVEETVVGETVVERVRVTEHFLAVEYIPVRVPDRRSRPRHADAELVG
jgi:Permuted papain-like amidase enzyme, YaeF/YiiX, C92 family